MTKLNVIVTVIVALQLSMALAGGQQYFSVGSSKSYMNAGNCYIEPGFIGTGSNVGVKYYNLPYGWKQLAGAVMIPNALNTRGEYNFGGRVVSGSDSYNEQFRANVNGLQVSLSAGSGGSKNLVIGSNFRSQDASDSDWNRFVSLLNGGGWLTDVDDAYWFPGVGNRPFGSVTVSTSGSSSGSGSGSSGYVYGQNVGSSPTIRIGGLLDSLFAPATTTTTVYVSTPSQTVSGGPSADDRKRALDNQYAATQALNDLNTLIGQLTASVDATAATVSKLQADVDGSRSSNSQCNDKIMELSKAKLTAETAIASISSQVNEYKARLADFTPALNNLIERRNQLVRSRSSIESSKSPNSNLLNQLETQFNSCSSQIDGYRTDYNRVQGSINSNNDQIASIQRNAADAPNQIRLANDQLSVVESTIADLQLKLSQAQAQKSKIQGDIVNYNNVISTSNTQISNLNSQNSRLSSQLSTLQSSIDTQTVQCSSYQRQSSEIRTSIASSQQDYDDLSRQIDVQDTLIANKRSELDRYQSESSALPSRLATLQNDLSNAQTALSRQYYVCNSAADSVNRARSDLDAANLKLTTERKFLSDAQAKLANLTAQKRAADDAVNKILSTPSTTTTTGGSTTGYTITVGGGSTGGISGVAGGSTGGSTGSSGYTGYIYGSPVAVGNIGDYLTRVYGSNVRTYWQPYAFSSSYSTMYPLSTITVNALYGRGTAGIFVPAGGSYLSGISRSQIGQPPANLVGDFTCSNNNYVTGYATVNTVQPGYLTATTPSGSSMNFRIGSCTQLEASRPQYIISTGDKVFYRAAKGLSGNDYHLHQASCVA